MSTDYTPAPDIQDLDDALSAIEQIAQDLIRTTKSVPASACGLDERCGTLFVAHNFIATKNPSRIDYYGGFEYVDKHDRYEIGDYTIYTDESDRVRDALEAWMEFIELHPED